MRQIFSIRFWAAVGALFGLFLLLFIIFRTADAIEGDAPTSGVIETDDTNPDGSPVEIVQTHRIDLVSLVFTVRGDEFGIAPDGTSTGYAELVLDADRTIRIVSNTPGEISCDNMQTIGGCAIVADLLGEAVVWFALVPMSENFTVEFPAIVELVDGYATLTNGWQLPYQPILNRRCEDEFESFSEWQAELGTSYTSVFTLEDRMLTDVVCDENPTEAITSASVPPTSADALEVTDSDGG